MSRAVRNGLALLASYFTFAFRLLFSRLGAPLETPKHREYQLAAGPYKPVSQRLSDAMTALRIAPALQSGPKCTL